MNLHFNFQGRLKVYMEDFVRRIIDEFPENFIIHIFEQLFTAIPNGSSTLKIIKIPKSKLNSIQNSMFEIVTVAGRPPEHQLLADGKCLVRMNP